MWFPQRVKLIISAKYRIRLTTISETIFTETRAVRTSLLEHKVTNYCEV